MIRLVKSPGNFKRIRHFTSNFSTSMRMRNSEVSEVKIPLGEGEIHLAGKFWGDKSKSPILCIHGAQDTAGSFDRLIPLLPKSKSYLAYDLFGHGLSSTLPDGLQFNVVNYLHHIRDLQLHFKIEKISIIGHSSGANLALTYGTLFLDLVNMIVSIDGRQPPVFEPPVVSQEYSMFMSSFYKVAEKNRQKFKKAFSMEELSERYEAATGGSVSKELAPFILNRCVTKAETQGKYFLTHDTRFTIPTITGIHYVQKFSEQAAIRMKFPILALECTKKPIFGLKAVHENILETLRENKNFELHKVDELHHVHLTHPEKVSKLISDFVLKHD